MALTRNQDWNWTRLLGSWFLRPILSLLRWFGIKRPLALTYEDCIKVFVKINDGSNLATVPIDLPKHWNVGQVKEYLVRSFMTPLHGFF